MHGRQVLLGGFAAMAMSFVWVACSSSSTATDCAFGAEGCACTSGGACDKGLACLSGKCVNPTTSTSTTSGSAGSTSSTTSTATTSGTTSGGGSSAGGSSATGGTTGAGGAAGTGGMGGQGGAGTAGSGGVAGSTPGLDGGRSDGSAGSGQGGGAGAGGAGGRGGAGGASAGAGGVPPVGTGGTAGSGTGGTGGVADAGPPGTTTLGGKCKADGDCIAGLACVKSSDNLGATPGGVGNGMCTADCTVNATACAPFGGICVAIDVSAGGSVTKAACFENCSIGPNPPAAPVFKCHGRTDAACEPLNQAETLFGCIPICLSDADCGSRKCDGATGLCVDTPMSGKPLGSGCTIVAGQLNTECAGGLCLPIEASPADASAPNPGICTALCRLGTLEACGYRATPLDAGPPVGACVLPWADTGYNTGDLGLCLQLCDVPGDCSYRASNWTCRTDIVLNAFGHSVCLTPRPD